MSSNSQHEQRTYRHRTTSEAAAANLCSIKRGLVYHQGVLAAMQAAAFRSLPAAAAASGRQLRHVYAAPRQRAPRIVKARATLPRGDDLQDQASPIAAQALQEYFELEKSDNYNAPSLDNFRLKYGIKRDVDGRVQLRKSDGTWMQLKLDMEVKGTMLLRNTKNDSIHVLQTDQLEQVDLSDDYLLLMLFADGAWEEQIQPIQLGSGGTDVEPLEVPEDQFRDFVGMIRTLQELDAEEEEEDGSSGAIDVKAEPASGR